MRFFASSFRKEVGLDLFFPKQMQESLKVREPKGKGPRKTPFVLFPKTRTKGIWLGILRNTAGCLCCLEPSGHKTI